HPTPLSDLALSRRLERAEGAACVESARSRRRLLPESWAEWSECGGAYAVFDGVASPITQSFGLGIFEELSAGTLEAMEKFFRERGAPVPPGVSALAGRAAVDPPCARNYRPLGLSSVLYRPVERPGEAEESSAPVRLDGRV